MRIVTGLEIFNKNFEGSVVTIGNFDGVHKGHVEIFRHLKERGLRLDLPVVVVTFEPHPLKILAPEKAPGLITTFEQKSELISASGIDCLVVIPFTPEFALTSAEEFVRNTLCDSLGMRHIVIGHDYAFGRGREGNYMTLEKIGAERGFTLEDMNPIGENGIVFSSSLVRRMVAEGDMESASRILGRYHMISGKIVHGREIGQTLGFPTANLSTFNELIPLDGVYAVMVSMDGELLKGACNIGLNPTFAGGTHTIEVFLLDFAGQIYGREITLYFVQRIREVRKFPDASALMLEIRQDVEKTRMILESVDDELIKIPIGNL
ncbi:MAG: bifunctional riboflavin kinase/FAD synthetase [Desulfuromonadaceae bacterium]|nr:bifunctional riboflavin kinase/FAD synthetase [Desulfuromonadaceae bacterium]